jgi:branched-chain amino acid transport system substrate-binding protein
VSLNYTAVHATAMAMKLAGSTTDAAAIRAQLDKAFKSLPSEHNPHEMNGVDERGGSTANTRVAVVDGGKVKEVRLDALAK